MKETTLEERLAGWTPRRPSARLEATLFGARPDSTTTEGAGLWRWLAPSTGIAAVVFLSLLSRTADLGSGLAGEAAWGAGWSSNLWAGGAARMDSQTRQNRFAGVRIEWTTPHATPSSIGSAMGSGTNRLEQ